MKVFAILFVTIAVASMAAGHSSSSSGSHCTGLAALLGPVLRLLQPLLNGVNSGLQSGACQVAQGLDQAGNAIQSTVSGVGTIAANTACGLGGTTKALPAALYKTTKNLQTKSGVVGTVLDTVTGAVSSSHHH